MKKPFGFVIFLCIFSLIPSVGWGTCGPPRRELSIVNKNCVKQWTWKKGEQAFVAITVGFSCHAPSRINPKRGRKRKLVFSPKLQTKRSRLFAGAVKMKSPTSLEQTPVGPKNLFELPTIYDLTLLLRGKAKLDSSFLRTTLICRDENKEGKSVPVYLISNLNRDGKYILKASKGYSDTSFVVGLAQKRPTARQEANNFGFAKSWSSKPWWHGSYIADWSVSIGLLGGSQLFRLIEPTQREFDRNDPSIGHKMNEDSVPEWLVGVLAAGVPLVLFGSMQGIYKSGFDFHHATLGLVGSLGLTLFLTEGLKVAVGRLRPDFIDRCQPDQNNVCTQSDAKILRNGRLSFPSGHSSFMFAGMTYMSLYIAGKLRLASSSWEHLLWKIPLVLSPLVVAGGTAYSRHLDRRHHWQDILAGSLIGFVSSVITYHLYFRPIWSKESHIPKTRRSSFQVVPVVSNDVFGIAAFGQF